MKIFKDINYGSNGNKNQVLDLYIPDCEVTDLLIYFHGGGLEFGDKNSVLVENMAKQGKAVISANYRMYPDAVFPEFLEDAAMAVNWAVKNIAGYIKVNKIFVGGSSAGAWITAMLAFAPQYLEKYNIQTTEITGYIINSAQMTTHFNVLREKGINTKRIVIDEAAPIYYINENTVFPNVFIIVADNDMACRLEQNQMFLKTMEVFGAPVERIRYKLMEGFRHCAYDRLEEFAEILINYMNDTN